MSGEQNIHESPTAALPSEILRFREVTFEETGETRTVVGDCKVCRRALERYATGVVSPAGLVHVADCENTVCGHDATGDGWWWPL